MKSRQIQTRRHILAHEQVPLNPFIINALQRWIPE